MQEESMKNLMEFYEDTLRSIEEGEIIQGTVLKIDKEEIFVDVGYKSEGVIPAKEFYCESSKDIFEVLSIGDPIEAIVIQSEDNEGRLILSKRRAVIEKAWRTAESARITGDSITGVVHEVVKGGLLLDIGVRAFLPASLIDVNRVSDLSSYIGQEFECKVINTNRFRKSIVLSRKACLEEGLEQERKDILEKFDVGQRMKGKVVNIVDFGVFVDIGGITGLVHISELSWKKINHPDEVVAVGDEVEVQILSIDREKERLSLGLKQARDKEWYREVKMLRIGEKIYGNVKSIADFGVFVSLKDGLEGLIHLSELAEETVTDPKDMVSIGDKLKVKVIDIDYSKKRICLSCKRVLDDYKVKESTVEDGEKLDEKLEKEILTQAGEEVEENVIKTAKIDISEEQKIDVEVEEPEEVKEPEEAKEELKSAKEQSELQGEEAKEVFEEEDDEEKIEESGEVKEKKQTWKNTNILMSSKELSLDKDDDKEDVGSSSEPGSLEDVLDQMRKSKSPEED